MKLLQTALPLLLLSSVALGQTSSWVEWNASSGVLPENANPSWTKNIVLPNNASTYFNAGSTAVVMDTDDKDGRAWYEQNGTSELLIPDIVVIEFGMMIVSEMSANSACQNSRRAADITVSFLDGYGIGLAFGLKAQSAGYINFYAEGPSAGNCCRQGAQYFYVETDVFQDYRLVIDRTVLDPIARLSVWDSTLGSYVLKVSAPLYLQACDTGTKPWIQWGAATDLSYGVSEWKYFAHNAGADLGTNLGASYFLCSPVVLNSTGVIGGLALYGSDTASDYDLTLHAFDLPANQFGYFLCSQTQGVTLGSWPSIGTLCLGGAIGRWTSSIRYSGVGGEFRLSLIGDTTYPTNPITVVTSGQTWNYQAWHRDLGVGGVVSNFTDAQTLTFL